MPSLRHSAVVVFGLLSGFGAQADDEPVSLDSVDTGQTRSLDSVDTGRTRSLDSIDTAETIDQDTLDTGSTRDLDDVDTGEMVDQDTLESGRTESLSEAERPPVAPSGAPAPLPLIPNDALRADAQAAHEALAEADRRASAANAAYSQMRAKDFPRGDAAAAIRKEYLDAQAAYQQAKARYDGILEQLDPAAIGY